MNSGIREIYGIPGINGSGPVPKYSSTGQNVSLPQSSSSSSSSSADGVNGISTQSPFLSQSLSSSNDSLHSSEIMNGKNSNNNNYNNNNNNDIDNNNHDNGSNESLKRKSMDDDPLSQNQSNHNMTDER